MTPKALSRETVTSQYVIYQSLVEAGLSHEEIIQLTKENK